jgi:hypothetical protein
MHFGWHLPQRTQLFRLESGLAGTPTYPWMVRISTRGFVTRTQMEARENMLGTTLILFGRNSSAMFHMYLHDFLFACTVCSVRWDIEKCFPCIGAFYDYKLS